MGDLRCKKCGRLLAKNADVNSIEIKCYGCNELNYISNNEYGSTHYRVSKLDETNRLRDNNDSWVTS